MSVLTERSQAEARGRRCRIALADHIVFVACPELAQRQSSRLGLAVWDPGLLTIAVRIDRGGFVIEFEDGGHEVYEGPELAAVLPLVPLYDADVRMWFDWPDDVRQWARLRGALRGLAESTGATVWAPPEGGRTRIAGWCRDLATVDGDGEPAVWQAYQADPPTAPRYVSDYDGRLLPASGLVLTGRPGVPLISAPDARLRDMADQYAAVGHRSDAFVIDLPVLEDGRIAACCLDGTRFAMGPRHLIQLIEARGWQGQPVHVLTDLTPRQSASLAQDLSEVGITLGQELPVVADAQPETATAELGSDWDPYEARYGPDPTRTDDDDDWGAAAVFLARPPLIVAPRRGAPHGLAWLPQLPQVNDEEFEVHVRCEWTSERVAAEGIPSPRLFLVGHLGAGSEPAVRVRVKRHGAVDVIASDVQPPAEFASLLAKADAYVLPARWLDRCLILLDDGTSVAASLRLAGAAHRIDGVPEDVVAWPSRLGGTATVYAVLPEAAAAGHKALRLYRRRPRVQPGRLIQVRVEAGLAIDIARTARRMVALPTVRTALPELRSAGVDLLLPAAHFARVRVLGLFTAAGRQWRPSRLPRHSTIQSLVDSAV